MSMRVLFLLSLSTFWLSGCLWTKNMAPVVHYGQRNGAGSAGVHNVLTGDTLYSIAQRYRLPMRDIAVLNRLKPPFKLKVGQRIKLPPPREYKVQAGDTLYYISRQFDVSSSEIVRLNNLKSPYILQIGQVLRLPAVQEKRTLKPKSKPANKTSTVVRRRDMLSAPGSQKTRVEGGIPMPKGKPSFPNASQGGKVGKVLTSPPKRASSKFLKPVTGRIVSNYGAKKSGLHNDGVNIAAPRGSSVLAAENGVVVYTGNALKGSGNLVLIRHDNQWMTAYAHLDKIGVRKGQTVSRGASIGNVGSTGSVSSPQLHFEVRRGTSAMNPVKYME